MTFVTAQQRVDEIQVVVNNEDDYEKAHKLEDRLYKDFVSDIAAGKDCDDVSYLVMVATVVASTKQLCFPRYCA